MVACGCCGCVLCASLAGAKQPITILLQAHVVRHQVMLLLFGLQFLKTDQLKHTCRVGFARSRIEGASI